MLREIPLTFNFTFFSLNHKGFRNKCNLIFNYLFASKNLLLYITDASTTGINSYDTCISTLLPKASLYATKFFYNVARVPIS